MHMREIEAKELLQAYKSGRCTDEEREIVETWYETSVSVQPGEISEKEVKSAADRVWVRLNQAPKAKTFRLWQKISVAAAVLLIVTAGLFYFVSNTTNHLVVRYDSDKKPGKSGATLTLANGKKIYISDIIAGKLADEGGVSITKDSSGFIIYTVTEQSNYGDKMNVLQTSKAEQSKVRLPDGSIVYLNAQSSLKYPSSFAKKARREVELTGEGFFQVTNDKTRPFLVKTKHQNVEVLGTEFNISSYPEDAATKTTLLEGSVKLATAGGVNNVKLTPGQQATLVSDKFKIAEVSASQVASWKDGYFMFDHENLDQIMKKLSRWYDVEIVFEDAELKERTFFGTISKFENVSKVLSVMQRTDVATFEIKNNSIIIKKN